jgi:hypothetical protein
LKTGWAIRTIRVPRVKTEQAVPAIFSAGKQPDFVVAFPAKNLL